MNQNLPKWIVSSTIQHFLTNDSLVYWDSYVDGKIPLMVAGQDYDQKIWHKMAQLSIVGLHYSRKEFEYSVQVQYKRKLDESNLYTYLEEAGLLASLLTDYQIFKLGNKVGDDGSLVSCSRLDNSGIVFHDFGRMDQHLDLNVVTVGATFGGRY